MAVRQGDVVWVTLPHARGSAPGGRRPAVVLQHDRFNRTNRATAVVVAVTSQMNLVMEPYILAVTAVGPQPQPYTTVATCYVYVAIPGDINFDGLVDVADYNVWAANVGAVKATWPKGDLNGDGLVDVADYDIWAANMGRAVYLPPGWVSNSTSSGL